MLPSTRRLRSPVTKSVTIHGPASIEVNVILFLH